MTTLLDTIEKGTTYLAEKGIQDARRNMEHLVIHTIGCSRLELYMSYDRPMTEQELTPLREKLKRRSQGEPLQHILGTVEFYKLKFKTDARALIPRPETEELVSHILNHKYIQEIITKPTTPLTPPSTPPQKKPLAEQLDILDVGTGSGVLGLSLATELYGHYASLTLTDISAEALTLAKENATLLGTQKVTTCQSDLFSNLNGKKFHIIAANLPYIADTDLPTLTTEVLHDPHTALFGGKDGLDIIRKFIQQAPSYLQPGGIIALEIGHNQAHSVETMLQQANFQSITTHKDLNQFPRFPIATHNGNS